MLRLSAGAWIVCLCVPTATLAVDFSGIYRPNGPAGDAWDCASIGMDGGAFSITSDTLIGVENECKLSNPVPVRNLPAILYDRECSAEGMTVTDRLMLMTADFGVYVITDGFVSELARCP